MSILFSSVNGWLVCHKVYIKKVYQNVNYLDSNSSFHLDSLFNISNPFIKSNKKSQEKISNKRKKRKSNHIFSEEVQSIKKSYEALVKENSSASQLYSSSNTDDDLLNESSRHKANEYFKTITEFKEFMGGNSSSSAIVADIDGMKYLLPPNSTFYHGDVFNLPKELLNYSFDLILLDPPWYNRFVKRRKREHPDHGYKFLDDSDLKRIPVGQILNQNGLIAVWTTNSSSHIKVLKEDIFPFWGVTHIATWFWIKVTNQGQLITEFSPDGGKQPYERLLFGVRNSFNQLKPEDNRCLVSIPSAVHSHKPPLTDILKNYLPSEPKCLELFARYLLPGWTSVGNQVLSLQLLSLYDRIS